MGGIPSLDDAANPGGEPNASWALQGGPASGERTSSLHGIARWPFRLRPFETPIAAAIVAVVLPGSGSPAAAAVHPTLRALNLQPLVVRGTGFRPLERVELLLSADGAVSRTAKATRGGTFVTRFSAVELGRCDRFVLQAVGSRGSRVELARLAPDCVEP